MLEQPQYPIPKHYKEFIVGSSILVQRGVPVSLPFRDIPNFLGLNKDIDTLHYPAVQAAVPVVTGIEQNGQVLSKQLWFRSADKNRFVIDLPEQTKAAQSLLRVSSGDFQRDLTYLQKAPPKGVHTFYDTTVTMLRDLQEDRAGDEITLSSYLFLLKRSLAEDYIFALQLDGQSPGFHEQVLALCDRNFGKPWGGRLFHDENDQQGILWIFRGKKTTNKMGPDTDHVEQLISTGRRGQLEFAGV